jgi:deoxyribodipyrimidine photo-lyase
MTKRILCWFRRDLRLDDNTALLAAYAAAEEVVPVFIFDDAILSRPDTGAVRVAFLLESLRNLDENLRARGSRLLLRRGRPEHVLAQLVTETAASAVYFNRDVEPFALVRDARVRAHLEGRCAVEGFDDGGLTAPEAVRTKAGTPYTVFTPYKQAVLAQAVPRPRPAPAALRTPADVPGRPMAIADRPRFYHFGQFAAGWRNPGSGTVARLHTKRTGPLCHRTRCSFR